MTVVEFFVASPLENMISCFSLRPNKVIFVGDGRRMRRMVPVYESIAKRLGIDAVFEIKTVQRNSVTNTVKMLEEIVESEEECCFDLTGGDDLSLVAMGIVFQRYKGIKNLQMQRFSIKTGKLIDCDNDDETPVVYNDVVLKCEEYIALYGGRITSSVRYNADRDVHLEKLWALSKRKPKAWNTAVNLLGQLAVHSSFEDGGKRIVIPKSAISRHNNRNALNELKDFLNDLEDNGLILKLLETNTSVEFAYGSNVVKKCLSKAGDVLELTVLSAASRLNNRDGTPYYADCLSGVVIDWDGKSKNGNGSDGTVNEVDVLLLHGLIPVFISCKNGGVDESELYKLSAVAERFGGKYAKKALVLSSFNKKGLSRQYFLERAADMGITVIENANRLSEKAFVEKLKKL